MSPYRPSRYPRRDVLKWIAAMPLAASLASPVPAWSRGAAPGMPAPAEARAAAPAVSVANLVAGNTAFALALYAALRQEADGNLIVSPYSVSQALAMTYAGGRGETAEQMREVLAFTLPQPELHEAFGALKADLVARGNTPDTGNTEHDLRALRIANGMWGELTFPFNPAYATDIEWYYGTALQRADFITAPDAAREEINAWVADQTENHIRDILPPGAVKKETRLVLANAIYFSGPWAYVFEPRLTHDDTFHRLDGTTITVPFMVQQVFLGYADADGYQVVEFPYADSGLALMVILPDDGQFEEVEAALSSGTVAGQLADSELRVYLPKFELDYETSPIATLQALGIVDAFDQRRADFSGMIDLSEMRTRSRPERLYISDVRHKAWIGVDEQYTEAAAVTTVGMGSTPVAAPPMQEPLEVRIDRPFLFLIRDTVTGTILFLGRVLDPSA